jgi:phosphomannomutase
MLSRIFRSYDIRGIYGQDVNEEIFDKIGNAFTQQTAKDIAVAHDPRLSSSSLLSAFMNGALSAERTVMNIGLLPLGCAYHWATTQNFDLAFITASHLPKEWNGLKLFHANGLAYMEEENQKIKEIVESNSYVTGVRGVHVREEVDNVIDLYINHLTKHIKVEKSKMKILIDCGNGTAGVVVEKLFRAAGFSVDLIFEKPDGNFPNRLSDPNEDPLTELRKRVSKYDMGIAFDGDCDRVVFVARDGTKLKPEQASYIMLGELLKNKKGKILANVECSRLIDDVAKKFGVELQRFRVGHTFMLDTINKTDALFAVESSSHFVVPFLSRFDDAIAVALYFTYALQKSGKKLEDILEELPAYYETRINFSCSDEKKFQVIDKLKAKFYSEYSDVDTMDGIRVNLENGWFLVRASNTGPLIRTKLEADSEASLNEIKNKFTKMVDDEIKQA